MNSSQKLKNKGSHYCSYCNKRADYLLIMLCNHNLCMDCASNFLISYDDANYVYINQRVECPICNSVTSIEENIAEELNLLKKSKKIRNPQLSSFHEPQVTCKEHPSELLNYFCFDCNFFICSECVVNGIHHNHKTMNKNKASQIMISKINELIIQKETNLRTINETIKEAEMKKNQYVSQIKIAKQNIRESLDFLISLIKEKEEELLSNLDNIEKKDNQEYKGFVNNLEQEYQEITNFIAQANNDIKMNNLVFFLLE